MYMARLHGFYGWNKKVHFNNLLWLCGASAVTVKFGLDLESVPAIFSYTVLFLLLTWTI